MKTIEYIGTVCAGKMSLLNSVRSELGLYTVESIAPDLTIASEMAYPDDYFERQMLVASDVTNKLLRFKDLRMPNLVVLIHRGLYDSQAFISAYVKMGLIPRSRASPQVAAWKANAKLLTDLVILVKTPAEVAFRRAKKKFSGLFQLEKRDIVLTIEFFEALEEAYEELEQRLPANSIVVDGTKPVRENRKILIKAINDFLELNRELGTNLVYRNKEGEPRWKKQMDLKTKNITGLRKEAVSP